MTPTCFAAISRAARALLAATALMAGGLAAAAPAVPTAPILRLETGNHLSLITRVSVDAAGRYLVTASEDKTIRVWSLTTGQPLATARPPIGEGSLGAIYAAALSPDGSTIAAGGNTAFDGENHALYLIDRASGNLREGGTLSGLEAPVQQLAWSPDGRLVAVGLRQQGVRVFSRELRFQGADEEYNDAVYGLDFSADGRLAAAGLDGFVRVYGFTPQGMRRIARKGLQGQPYAVAFAPDGRTLAVGYADAARVDLLDADSLEVRRTLRFDGDGNLGRVAWAKDGRALFAAGTASRNGRFPVLRFDPTGKSAAVEVGSFDNIVVSLAAVADDGVAAGSAEPAWAVFDATGKERFARRRSAADFRDAGERFRVSDDGRVVSFPFAPGDARVASFDVRRGEVRSGAPDDLHAPRTTARGLAVEGWRNGDHPRVNGHALALLPHEVARSVALAPDGRRLVLGTEWYLRAFDEAGRALWERRLPATAWAVNTSGDGRWAIAALGDGTIRWYRLADGEEQAALFAHPDRERWVLWAPSGHYDTSVSGEGLIGWQLNSAYNRSAQFYPVGRFRKLYYRPTVLQRVFDGVDLATALAEPDAENAPAGGATRGTGPSIVQVLPPRIELRGERELVPTAAEVRTRFAVFSPADAPVEEIKIRAGGRLVRTLDNKALPRPGADGGVELDVPVKLPAGDGAEVTIVARNRNGLSEPAVLHIAQPAGGRPAPPAAPHYKRMYVFAAGISAYPTLRPEFQLKFPAKDARDFVDAIKTQSATLADAIEVRLLTDGEATKGKVLDALAWVREKVGPDDLGVVFLAGHGFMLGNRYYFAGADIDLADEARGAASAVPGAAIQEALSNLRGRGAFFIDTCHSGFALSDLRIKSDVTGALNDMGDEHAVVILAGSAGRQSATEADEWNNGAFTKAIVEGLRGKADYTGTGLITPPLLHTYVSGRVRTMTEGVQTPKMVGAVFDEPIAVIRK